MYLGVIRAPRWWLSSSSFFEKYSIERDGGLERDERGLGGLGGAFSSLEIRTVRRHEVSEGVCSKGRVLSAPDCLDCLAEKGENPKVSGRAVSTSLSHF